MQNLTWAIMTKIIPPIMLRKHHVLVVVQDKEGKYILGSKNMYPQDIYRLVGGGVEESEDPQLSAAREVEEELGLRLNPQDFRPLATITALVSEQGKSDQITFVTYLFNIKLDNQEPKAASDLDDLKMLNAMELSELIQRYGQLSSEIDPKYGFAWADYGKLYGPIHQLALELTLPH